MNTWLVLAALLSVITCGLHVFAGGPGIHVPMLQSSLQPVVKGVWSVVWHAVTAIIFTNSAAFYIAAQNPDTALVISLYPILISVVFTVLFLFYGLRRVGSVWPMPQWTAFALIAVLAAAGLVRG